MVKLANVLSKAKDGGKSPTGSKGPPSKDPPARPARPTAMVRQVRAEEEEGYEDDEQDMLLEEPTWVEKIYIAKDNFWKAIEAERERREDPGYVHKYPRIQQLVIGKWAMKFESVMGIVIVFNCFTIGLKASYDSPTADADDGPLGPIFFILENTFTATFVAELWIRVLAYGYPWFFKWGNAADALLVLVPGVLAVWILGIVFGVKSSLLRTFTILRVFRLVRLARHVRLLPQFKEMWLLIRGLLDSMSTLFWTYVIITSTLYIFAIATVDLVARQPDFVDDPFVHEKFGTVLNAMFTLFQVMTLDSWTAIARPMMRQQFWVGWYLFFFISIGCFVLMNLITAVIVENAFAISKQDDEEQAKKKEIQRERDMAELTELFMDLDADQSGSLTVDEFQQATKHPMIRRKFMMLDFGPDDLDELWSILDDGDGNLSVEEFSLGLRKMKGEAKSKDILLCVKAMRMTDQHLNLLDEKIDTIETNVHKLWGEVGGVEMDLDALHTTCKRLNEAVNRAANNAERIGKQRAAANKTRANLREAAARKEAEEEEARLAQENHLKRLADETAAREAKKAEEQGFLGGTGKTPSATPAASDDGYAPPPPERLPLPPRPGNGGNGAPPPLPPLPGSLPPM